MTRATVANSGGNKVELPPASATPQGLTSPVSASRVALHPQSGTWVAVKNRQVPPTKIAKYQPKTFIGGTCGTCTQLLAHTRKANKYNIKTRIKKELANKVPPATHRRVVTSRA